VAVILALSSNGDRDVAAAPVPPGFVAHVGRAYAFARPRALAPLPTKPRPAGEELVAFQGGGSVPDLPAQVGIGVEDEVDDSLEATVRLALEESRIAYPAFRVLRRSAPEIAGGRAVRIDSTYESFGANPRRVRMADLYVRTEDGRGMNLWARGAEADFARLGLARSLDSLRLR